MCAVACPQSFLTPPACSLALLCSPSASPSCPSLWCRGDVVQIDTWFQEDGKLAAQRDWSVKDKATGRVLGRATSTWVMINMQTRRLIKLPPSMRAKCEAFQLKPPRHAIPRECTRQKLPELQLPAEVGRGRSQGCLWLTGGVARPFRTRACNSLCKPAFPRTCCHESTSLCTQDCLPSLAVRIIRL